MAVKTYSLWFIKVAVGKFSGGIYIERRTSSSCSETCLPEAGLTYVVRCFIGNYTNSIAVGTGTVGNFILLSPFDQINQPNIQDCKG